jgi:glycosyltransferase involved in cell wall biosynthesis
MDSGGGAADGFIRIHQALLREGDHSFAYVIKHKRTDIPDLIDARRLLSFGQKIRWSVERALSKIKRIFNKPIGVYDFDSEANFPPGPIIRHAQAHSEKWDLIIVHWAGGFVRPETVQKIAKALGARVALWQVDMAHVTGGCHSNLGCLRYQMGCGMCPLIHSTYEDDTSSRQAENRRLVWHELGAMLFAPTEWSARQARESSILKTLPQRIFPIPLNIDILKPEKNVADLRAKLGLPTDRRILLVRGINPALTYKGFGLFLEVLKRLDELNAPIHIAILGESGLIDFELKNLKYTELGFKRGDEAIATAYQASDFFVNPSTNDNGPMMLSEALVCGLPVVAFPVGLPPIPWGDSKAGVIAEPIGNVDALTKAIMNCAEISDQELTARKDAAAKASRTIYSSSYFRAQIKAALSQ